MTGEDADSRVFRRALVEQLQRDGQLRSPRVAAAMEAVPREVFVPGLPLDEVYRASDAIVTKRVGGVSVSSASAPDVMALMLEQLDPVEGNRVLEIGAGTGYNAALLAHLVGDTGEVVTLDIDDDLVLAARDHLLQAGYGQVRVVQTDGALGCADQYAFDRIILTVASNDIAPAWREQLARPHGRLVMPLGLRGPQRSVAFVHEGDHLVSDSLRNCSFIPLRGLLAGGAARVPLDPDGIRTLIGPDESLPMAVDQIAASLRAPLRACPSGVWTTLDAFREGLSLWLVIHQPGVYTLWHGGPGLPDLFGLADRANAHGTLCVIDSTNIVLLGWADAAALGGRLDVLAPSGAEALADRVTASLQQWVLAGRPTDARLQVRAHPRGTRPDAALDGTRPNAALEEVVIVQRWTEFVLNWNQPPAIFTV